MFCCLHHPSQSGTSSVILSPKYVWELYSRIHCHCPCSTMGYYQLMLILLPPSISLLTNSSFTLLPERAQMKVMSLSHLKHFACNLLDPSSSYDFHSQSLSHTHRVLEKPDHLQALQAHLYVLGAVHGAPSFKDPESRVL